MLVELNKQSGARPHAVILMASESSVTPRRTRIVNPSSLQQLPNGQEVSEILQQMCGEISQTTTAEMAEIANSPASQSKLQDLLPVYFYSWQLKSPEAVIIHLLLNYFILWRDGSEMRRDRRAVEEQIERLKSRVAELEKMRARELEPDINRLTKQFQDLKLENERLQRALNEVVTSTEEGTDTPATPSYPHLVENCCTPSVFVHGELEYECPHVSACPLHQDVSPHTHNWHSVVSGRRN